MCKLQVLLVLPLILFNFKEDLPLRQVLSFFSKTMEGEKKGNGGRVVEDIKGSRGSVVIWVLKKCAHLGEDNIRKTVSTSHTL